MLRTVILLLIAALPASGNPVSGYFVDPPHTMVAENVLVGVTEKGAVVSGRYRFRVTPDAPEHWLRPPYLLVVQLPVPIPEDLTKNDDIEVVVQPVMTIKGAKYSPAKEVGYYRSPPFLGRAKLAVFFFHVDRKDLEDEFELQIQYDQPIVKTAGKEMIYYVPFLPGFKRYEAKMDLRRDSYLITFESHGPISLFLATPVSHLQRADPRLVSVRPEHMEVIGVEKVSNQPAEPTRASAPR